MLRTLGPSKYLAAAVAVVALMLPATAAGSQDLHSNPAAAGVQQEETYQDLRNPDSKAAAIEAERGEQETSTLDTPSAQVVHSSGFDWGDAAIGAGSVLGLLMISLSVMFGVVHRRSRTATT